MSIIQDFFKRYLPAVKADEGEEELVDPQTKLRVIHLFTYYIMLYFDLKFSKSKEISIC